MKPFFTAALLCALPAFAMAHDYTLGGIAIDHPYAFETPPMAATAGGYFTVTNTGESTDTLLAVEADFPKVMIHQTTEANGVATMSHIPEIPLAPGETVTFEPGGYHVMFMGLNGRELKAGESFPAVLIFEQAGRLDIVFDIAARQGAGHGMDGHGGQPSH